MHICDLSIAHITEDKSIQTTLCTVPYDAGTCRRFPSTGYHNTRGRVLIQDTQLRKTTTNNITPTVRYRMGKTADRVTRFIPNHSAHY